MGRLAHKRKALFSSLAILRQMWETITTLQPQRRQITLPMESILGSQQQDDLQMEEKFLTFFVKRQLGFKNFSPAFLDPTAVGDVILHGVNYASSASGIFNSTGTQYVS
ncbi:unnamed protein product [Malus baccata var. baccata]